MILFGVVGIPVQRSVQRAAPSALFKITFYMEFSYLSFEIEAAVANSAAAWPATFSR
jgi:hypothetical protein